MIQNLESLIELQKIDFRIHELNLSQSTFPKELADLQDTVGAEKKAMDTVTTKIEKIATQKNALNDKVNEAKAALEKSNDRLNSIKTNREYDAVHNEIENFKATISGADEKIKKFDTDIENQKQLLETRTAEYEKVKGDNESKITELTSKISSIDSLIEEQKKLRDAIVATIPKPLLRTYEHILSRKKNGKVLSFVNDDTRTCSSCFKVLETHLVNEIRRGTKMLNCQNCGAIFIWESEAPRTPE